MCAALSNCSSAMDRTVLLVLLTLQVFLLITTFASTDTAALVTDDQQQPNPLAEEGTVHHRQLNEKKGPNCSWKKGRCRPNPPTSQREKKPNPQNRRPKYRAGHQAVILLP